MGRGDRSDEGSDPAAPHLSACPEQLDWSEQQRLLQQLTVILINFRVDIPYTTRILPTYFPERTIAQIRWQLVAVVPGVYIGVPLARQFSDAEGSTTRGTASASRTLNS
jgi:hypothetical protein